MSIISQLKNGQDGKFYVTCILPQLKKKHLIRERNPREQEWGKGGSKIKGEREPEQRGLEELATDCRGLAAGSCRIVPWILWNVTPDRPLGRKGKAILSRLHPALDTGLPAQVSVQHFWGLHQGSPEVSLPEVRHTRVSVQSPAESITMVAWVRDRGGLGNLKGCLIHK